jgi:hypothetical protein
LSDHIELVKKAIEFRKPDYLPLEVLDVPFLYDAYKTLDSEKVELIPGVEDFDSIWVQGFWFPEEIGKNDLGEVLRKDEYGILTKVPRDTNSAYVILEEPLRGKNSLKDYKFPDKSNTKKYFDKFSKIIKSRYPDRFINSNIDPAAFLTASFLMGTDELYLKMASDLNFVIEVIEHIFEYHYSLIEEFAKCGSHMVTYLDEFAGSSGMMFNPDIWRKYFKKYYSKFFKLVHEAGMYGSICLDGNFSAVIDDLLEMELDVIQCPETKAIGLETLSKNVKGRKCIKCGVDMMHTLSLGKPEEVYNEAKKVVEMLSSKDGGFIAVAVKWHRPQYPMQNVLASVKAFNEYRKH